MSRFPNILHHVLRCHATTHNAKPCLATASQSHSMPHHIKPYHNTPHQTSPHHPTPHHSNTSQHHTRHVMTRRDATVASNFRYLSSSSLFSFPAPPPLVPPPPPPPSSRFSLLLVFLSSRPQVSPARLFAASLFSFCFVIRRLASNYSSDRCDVISVEHAILPG